MATYSNLPSELRQRILSLLIPDEVEYQHWPEPLLNLFLVNKQFLEDFRHLLHAQPPTYTLSTPFTLLQHTVLPQSQLCPVQRVSTLHIRLFESATTEIDWISTSNVWFVQESPHHDLLEAWFDFLPQILSDEVKTVIVDATPASGSIRRKPIEYLAFLVNDYHHKDLWTNFYQYDVDSILEKISSYCGSKVNIKLSGVYSIDSQVSVEKLKIACQSNGFELQTDVRFVHKPQRLLSGESLKDATLALNPSMEDLGFGKDFLQRHRICERLWQIEWSPLSLELYRSCGATDPEWTSEILRWIIIIYGNRSMRPYRTEREYMDDKRLKLIHSMANDLELCSETIIEEPFRYVVLTRQKRPHPLTQCLTL